MKNTYHIDNSTVKILQSLKQLSDAIEEEKRISGINYDLYDIDDDYDEDDDEDLDPEELVDAIADYTIDDMIRKFNELDDDEEIPEEILLTFLNALKDNPEYDADLYFLPDEDDDEDFIVQSIEEAKKLKDVGFEEVPDDSYEDKVRYGIIEFIFDDEDKKGKED